MRRILAICVLLICAFSEVSAQQLTLPDAVNIALKNSLDIQLAQNKISTDSINNNIGMAGGLPLVTGSITDNEQLSSVNQKLNTGTTISRAAAASNSLGANVTGSILLYNGGRVIATKKRLAELEKQSREKLTSQVQNVLSDVMTAYYDIIRQQTYVKTIDRSIEASQQKLEIVKVSQKAGLANNADLFQAQIDLNVLLQSKQAQETVIAQAKTELLRLITLKPDSAIIVIDTILVDRSLTLEPIMAGLSKNADILSAEEQIKINMQVVKETEAQRYPSIRGTSGLNFTRNQAAAGQVLLNQNYGPFIGVNIAIPIYNGGIYRRQKKTADIEVKNAELQKNILIRDYSSQVVKLYQSYSDALNQLDTEVKNYKLSGQLLDLSLKRFQLRQATIVEVKNAQQNFEQSGYRVVNLSYAAKTAEIGLKKLANQLSL